METKLKPKISKPEFWPFFGGGGASPKFGNWSGFRPVLRGASTPAAPKTLPPNPLLEPTFNHISAWDFYQSLGSIIKNKGILGPPHSGLTEDEPTWSYRFTMYIVKNYDVLVQKYYTDGAESIYWFHTTPYFCSKFGTMVSWPKKQWGHHSWRTSCWMCHLPRYLRMAVRSWGIQPTKRIYDPINQARWTPSPFIIRVKITPKALRGYFTPATPFILGHFLGVITLLHSFFQPSCCNGKKWHFFWRQLFPHLPGQPTKPTLTNQPTLTRNLNQPWRPPNPTTQPTNQPTHQPTNPLPPAVEMCSEISEAGIITCAAETQ